MTVVAMQNPIRTVPVVAYESPHCENDMNNNSSTIMIDASHPPQSGDIVTLENLVFIPQNNFIPEPLFDLTSTTTTTTTTTIVLDGGHYLPGLHEIIRTQCSLNTTISNITIDAGYGHYRSDLVFHVPVSKLLLQQQPLKVGTSIRLQPSSDDSITVHIKDILDDGNIVVLDANSPLAGASYLCSFKLIAIHRIYNPTFMPQRPPPIMSTSTTTTPILSIPILNPADAALCSTSSKQYQIATFALGCFWGAELAYMRTNGVVGTRVGYTNGVSTTTTTTTTHYHHPTYQEVCHNNDRSKQYCEAVQIIYDSSIVSYTTLIDIAIERIRNTTSKSGYDLSHLFRLENDDDDDYAESKQYRHGIYYHNQEQHDILQSIIRFESDTTTSKNDMTTNALLFHRYQMEVGHATTFWEAEDYHQQYLYKGGQSARKGATEPIRCYG